MLGFFLMQNLYLFVLLFNGAGDSVCHLCLVALVELDGGPRHQALTELPVKVGCLMAHGQGDGYQVVQCVLCVTITDQRDGHNKTVLG
jgi:hypothetical protein